MAIDGIESAKFANSKFEKMAIKNGVKIIKKVKNIKSMALPLAIVGGAIGITGTAVRSLFDSDKGSSENRKECAKEHLKNDAGFFTKLGILGAGGYIVNKNKSTFKPLFTRIGSFIGKVANKASGLLSKIGINAKAISKNPVKTGKFAILGGAALYVVNSLFKNIFKSGQIDQKYNDKAQAETQAQENAELKRQQIFEQLQARQEYLEMLEDGKNPVMEFYRNGGRGVY